MGARGRQAGEEVMVADLRIAVPRPPMAMTLPAGTWCNLSSPRPIIRYNPSTCTSRHQQPEISKEAIENKSHRKSSIDTHRTHRKTDSDIDTNSLLLWDACSLCEMSISQAMTCHVMGCQSICCASCFSGELGKCWVHASWGIHQLLPTEYLA